MKKAQSALEFILVLSFVLFFFILFYAAIQESMGDKIKAKNDLALKNSALAVKNEIDLAYSASDGYRREFIILSKLGNVDYSINITSGFVYVKTSTSAMALPVANVEGDLILGTNIIQKQNNTIYLNK
jgi:hypothetical protein